MTKPLDVVRKLIFTPDTNQRALEADAQKIYQAKDTVFHGGILARVCIYTPDCDTPSVTLVPDWSRTLVRFIRENAGNNNVIVTSTKDELLFAILNGELVFEEETDYIKDVHAELYARAIIDTSYPLLTYTYDQLRSM